MHRITYSQYFILYELQQNCLYKRILNINDYLQYDLHINVSKKSIRIVNFLRCSIQIITAYLSLEQNY